MNILKLIYFEDCPNAQKAKNSLLKMKIPFDVIVQDELREDSPYREYSSPTILYDNDLIFGQKIGKKSAACSIEKFDEKLILKRLEQRDDLLTSKVTKKSALATIGSIGSGMTVGLCPFCIPAIGTFLSSVGLGFLIRESILQPLLVLFLVITMVGLFYSFIKEHRNIGPLLLGSISGVALYLGRYYYFGSLINLVLMYGGITAIISVGLWNLHLRKQSACPSCIPQKKEVAV